MEFELPKINVSFEYDEEKDEIVFVINGVEKRVKIEDMITEMENLQEQNIALEQESCDDCISRKEVIQIINDFSYKNEHEETLINERIKNLPSIPSQSREKSNKENNNLPIKQCKNMKEDKKEKAPYQNQIKSTPKNKSDYLSLQSNTKNKNEYIASSNQIKIENKNQINNLPVQKRKKNENHNDSPNQDIHKDKSNIV